MSGDNPQQGLQAGLVYLLLRDNQIRVQLQLFCYPERCGVGAHSRRTDDTVRQVPVYTQPVGDPGGIIITAVRQGPLKVGRDTGMPVGFSMAHQHQVVFLMNCHNNCLPSMLYIPERVLYA